MADPVNPVRSGSALAPGHPVVSIRGAGVHGASAQRTKAEAAIVVRHGPSLENDRNSREHFRESVGPFYGRGMATRAERTWDLSFPPDKVIDAIRNPALIERSEKSRDALEVRVEDKEKTDTRHRYTVHTKAYAVGVTGIDKTKTEPNRTEVSIDLPNTRGSWEWFGSRSDVTVKGEYIARAQGEGSTLTLTVEIEVRIWGVGSVIEKKVRAGFEDAWPGYLDLVREYAAAA